MTKDNASGDKVPMNCKQAKKISLTDLMDRLGYKPSHSYKGGQELCYLSPFRAEATPSFFINVSENVYYDFGMGEGDSGSLEFAIKYLETNNKPHTVSDALKWLSDLGFSKENYTKPLFPFEKRNTIAPKNLESDGVRDLQFIRAGQVEHPAIFQYLANRGISEQLIRKYLLQIQYRNLKKDKVFFGFGMQNRAGGYELRSASDTPVFKSALIARAISIIPGLPGSNDKVSIFEGMTDFLSFLELYRIMEAQDDIIIMHSLSSFNETLDYIKGQGYKSIDLYLDNDMAGLKHAKKFMDDTGLKIIDNSINYKGFNDLNEFLISNYDNLSKLMPSSPTINPS